MLTLIPGLNTKYLPRIDKNLWTVAHNTSFSVILCAQEIRIRRTSHLLRELLRSKRISQARHVRRS